MPQIPGKQADGDEQQETPQHMSFARLQDSECGSSAIPVRDLGRDIIVFTHYEFSQFLQYAMIAF